jgi:hypothetical protein
MGSLLVLSKIRIACFFAAVSSGLWLCPIASAAPKTTIVPANGAIDFGSFAVLPACSNCSVTISPTGVRTASGGIVLTSANPGRAATFSVTEGGCSCKAYAAALTPTSVAQTKGGVVMTLGNFTTAQNATLPPNTLSVGATLTIAGRGTAGSYAGWTYTVTTTP